MQLRPNDIYIRNNTAWIAQGFLLLACNGLTAEYMMKARSAYKASVSPSFHGRDILPDTGKAWRWAFINNSFYYAYDNIPDKAPAHYRSQLPGRDALLQIGKAAMVSPSNHDFESHFKACLNHRFTTYLRCYNDCTRQQQENLSKAAAIMDGAVEYIRASNIDTRKYHFFQQLANFISTHDVPYFGSNVRVVKRKIEAVMAGTPIVEVIRLPRADNDNAAKGFHDEEIRSWVLQLRDYGANYTNTFIIKKVQDMCMLTNKPAPKDRWIGGIMEEHNTRYLTAENRFGSKGRFGIKYRGYQPMQNALFAGDCWQIDGTRVNLADFKHKVTLTGPDGKEIERTRQEYLYIVAVRDVHSGDVIGWNYSITEDRWAVFNALRMAARETGYLPFEMIFDKFPGHNTPEMKVFLEDLRQWGVTVTLSSDPNTKPGLERWFGTLQTVFMQESQYYYGQGVRSRRMYAHRSEQYIKRMRSQAAASGFNFDAAAAETDNIIDAYRNTPYCTWSRKHSTVQLSPLQLRQNSETPNAIRLQQEDFYYLFGFKIKLPVDGAGLIRKEIQKVVYYWRVKAADYQIFANNSHVLVCYDVEDLTEVMLYSITDGPIKQFLGRAYEEVPAQRYGPDAQWDVIRRRSAMLDEIDEYRKQELEYRKTGTGYDALSLIAPTTVTKRQAEQAESKYLGAEPTTDFDDDSELIINPRTQY